MKTEEYIQTEVRLLEKKKGITLDENQKDRKIIRQTQSAFFHCKIFYEISFD